MGKGDKKTKRGKIAIGSYGVRRPRKSAAGIVSMATVEAEKPKKAAVPKAEAKPTVKKTPKSKKDEA